MPLRLPPNVDASDRALLERAEDLRRQKFSAGVSPKDVDATHQQYGVDFATALLYTHFASQLAFDPFASPSQASSMDFANPSIAVAPGAFHEAFPQLGADGQTVVDLARQRGWNCDVIPTPGLGTLDQNASVIVDWFDGRPSAKVIVVAISKGAADLRMALTLRPDLWARIQGWICVSGILFGTPIANWLLERKRFWLTTKAVLWYWNRPRSSLSELCHHGGSRSARLPAPFVRPSGSDRAERRPFCDPIQVVGFPLRKHLASWRSRLWHRRFATVGPSDGVVWLRDLLLQPSTVVPVWGADHYMRTRAEVAPLCLRLVERIAARDRSTMLSACSEAIA